MGLVLGIIAVIVTLVGAVLIAFLSGGARGTGGPAISAWTWTIGGSLISAALIASHYMQW